MTIVDLIGVVGTILNIWGNLLIAHKTSFGWWVRIACNLVWILHGAYASNSPVILNAVVFLGINCYGIWKWKKNPPPTHCKHCGEKI